MERREGLIEFRTIEVPVYDRRGRLIKTEAQLEYRQCFKGLWDEWKPVFLLENKCATSDRGGV